MYIVLGKIPDGDDWKQKTGVTENLPSLLLGCWNLAKQSKCFYEQFKFCMKRPNVLDAVIS